MANSSVAGGSVASGSERRRGERLPQAAAGRRPPQAATRRRRPFMYFLCTKGSGATRARSLCFIIFVSTFGE